MAGKSKVNVKFVVILVGVLVVGAAGVGGAVMYVTGRTGEQLMRKGDAAIAKSDFVTAEKMYSRAVNKNPTNEQWLRKWGEVMVKVTPALQTEYEQEYYTNYRNMLRSLAVLVGTDVGLYHDFLGRLHEDLSYGPVDKGSYDFLINETEGALKNFADHKSDAKGRENPDSLRRYRGLARVRMMGEASDSQNAEQLQLAKEDLEAVLKVDPSDDEALAGLAGWYALQAEKVRARGGAEDATALEQSAMDLVRGYRKDHPDSGIAAALDLGFDMALARREAQTLGGAEAVKKYQAAMEALKPRADEIAAIYERQPPEKILFNSLLQLHNIENMLDRSGHGARILKILEKRIAIRPEDHMARFQRAVILGERREYAEANKELQAIIDAPIPPLSFDGVLLYARRPGAALMQARNLLSMWEATKDAEEKKKHLADAIAARDRALDLSPAENPQLLFIDALVAVAQDDKAKAKRLFIDYLRKVNDSDAEAIRMLARVHVELNELGDAERRLDRLAGGGAILTGDLAVLAQVKLRLNKIEDADRLVTQLQTIDPDSEVAMKLRDQIDIAMGKASSNPIVNAMSSAKKLQDEQKPEEAAKVLSDAARANGYPSQLVIAAAYQYVTVLDQPEEALKLLDAGAAANESKPEAATLKQMAAALRETDPYKARLMVIEFSGLKPGEKLVAKVQAARGFKKDEDRAAFLAQLEKEYPEEPTAVEQFFIEALEKQDWAKAQKMVDLAKSQDMDKAQGATLDARLRFAQGKQAEGISLLQKAAEEYALGMEAWRLLADFQRRAGRGADAVASYKRALAIRPGDVPTIKDEIKTMVLTNRAEEALTEARVRKEFAQSDPEFMELLIQLEGHVGDKSVALEYWKRLLERTPKDRKIRFAIASLLVDTHDFKGSRDMLDELRKEQDSLDLVALDARWWSDQGRLSDAQRVFSRYIVDIPRAELTSLPYLVMGDFLLSRNMDDAGFVAFQQGRRYQDAKAMDADKALSDAYARRERLIDAIPASRRIVDGKADNESSLYRKRLVEGLTRQREYAAAQALIDELGASVVERDLVLLLLSADIAKGQGQDAKMREVMDRVKTTFPNDPMVWIKSAQMVMDRIPQDADADLDKAIQIDPVNWQAHRLKAQALAKQGKLDAALKELQEAIRLNPELNDTRIALMEQYIQSKRENDAVAVGEEAAKRRPGDVQLLVDLGEVFVRNRKWNEAAIFYKKAYDQSKLPVVVQRYLDTLLNSTPAGLTEMESTLRAAGAVVDQNPAMLMARAGLLTRRGRDGDAMRDVRNGLRAITSSDVNQISAWYDRLTWVYPDAANRAERLEILERDGVAVDWLRYFRALVLLSGGDPAAKQTAMALLERLMAPATEPVLLQTAYRQYAGVLYQDRKFAEAAEVMKKSVELFPSDWEQMNNLASTLSEDLGKPQEALPFALKAVEMADTLVAQGRAVPYPYDTLASIHIALNKPADAEPLLKKALDMAGTAGPRFAALLNMSRACSMLGRPDDAKGFLREASSVQDNYPGIASPRQKGVMDDLKKQLGI